MHRVLQSHLETFVEENGLESDSISEQFEKLCNYAFIQPRVSSRIDLDEVTTGDDDDGIDGLALIINEDLITSKEDAEVTLRCTKRNNEAEIVFIQSKTSEGYDLGDFLKFKEAVIRFVSDDNYCVNSALQNESREAYDIVLKNVGKLKGGRPKISVLYATAGVYHEQSPHEIAKKALEDDLRGLGYFSDVTVEFIGREEIIKSWVSSFSALEVDLQTHSQAGLPQIAGVEESYLVVVKAKDFVDQVLASEDGSIRSQLFEDNVRHYLGEENAVNNSIKETILDPKNRTRFPVLNNGVTIVSPDVLVRTNRIFMKNFQIVNGCQTSHVLFENRLEISDEMMLTLKVVETEDEDLFSDLVRATNSQSEVSENQFLSLSPVARKIENYFNTFEGQEGRIYFERRVRQYAGKGVPSLRIIDLDTAARAFCSMFLRRPDLAFRYPKSMYEQLSGEIFSPDNKESLFYASSLVIYRIHVLSSNGLVGGAVRKYKWHVLPIVAAILAGKEIPRRNSRKADTYADKIIKVFQAPSERASKILCEAMDVINGLGEITVDRLKRQAVLDELLDKIK